MGVLRGLFLIVLLAVFYMLGARFGLPAWILDQIDAAFETSVERGEELGEQALAELEDEALELLERFDRDHVYDGHAKARMTVAGNAVNVAPPPMIVIERTSPIPVLSPEEQVDEVTATHLCLTSVSNAPPANDDLSIIGYTDKIQIEGVTLLATPASNTCLSSGFGPRGSSGRLHKGVDYFSRTGGNVLAAADGTVVEATYRDDYGYMVVIDHGDGIYTRYAHLKRIDEAYAAGVEVAQGDVLGPIGSSGAYTDVVHLHFEVLQGDYNTPRKSFGLVPLNPYAGLMP